MTLKDVLGIFDPFQIVIKPDKKEPSAYMIRQNNAIKNYRHWYYLALERGVLTETQMKKKRLVE
jgi:hypothetical protein